MVRRHGIVNYKRKQKTNSLPASSISAFSPFVCSDLKAGLVFNSDSSHQNSVFDGRRKIRLLPCSTTAFPCTYFDKPYLALCTERMDNGTVVTVWNGKAWWHFVTSKD